MRKLECICQNLPQFAFTDRTWGTGQVKHSVMALLVTNSLHLRGIQKIEVAVIFHGVDRLCRAVRCYLAYLLLFAKRLMDTAHFPM